MIFFSVSPVGYVKRTSWSDEEKSHVLKTFRESIESQTLPSTESLAKFISDSPILKNRNPIQLKSWLSNQMQKQRKDVTNCRRRKGMYRDGHIREKQLENRNINEQIRQRTRSANIKTSQNILFFLWEHKSKHKSKELQFK